MSPVLSAALNVLIFAAMLPVALAAGVFVVAAYRLAILQGRSATAAQVILGGLTFLGLGCVPVALLILLPASGVRVPDSLTATVVAAAGFGVWLPMGVIAWAIMYRRTGAHRRTGPPRRRYRYRRLAVVVVIAAVTACGPGWVAPRPFW